jgi:hypothetical protein
MTHGEGPCVMGCRVGTYPVTITSEWQPSTQLFHIP